MLNAVDKFLSIIEDDQVVTKLNDYKVDKFGNFQTRYIWKYLSELESILTSDGNITPQPEIEKILSDLHCNTFIKFNKSEIKNTPIVSELHYKDGTIFYYLAYDEVKKRGIVLLKSMLVGVDNGSGFSKNCDIGAISEIEPRYLLPSPLKLSELPLKIHFKNGSNVSTQSNKRKK